jgi:hypothetical protein
LQNLEKVLEVLGNLEKECERITGDEIENFIPQDPKEAVEVLFKMGNGISLIFRKLSPLRERVVSERVRLEGQLKEKDPP